MALHDMTQKEAAGKAINLIMDAVNVMGSDKEVVEGIVFALQTTHRTLQENYWRVMIAVMKEYAEFNTDMRNEDAVAFCKFVKAELEKDPSKGYLAYV